MKRSRRARDKRRNRIAVFVIAVFGVVVLSVNAVGQFVAEKILYPLVNATGTASETVTREAQPETLTVYLLSYGACPSAAEAEQTRGDCRAKGGGAFLWQEQELFFMTDSCYLSREKAQTRKKTNEQLSLREVRTPSLRFRLTGKMEQIETCEACLSAAADCVREVLAAAEKAEDGATGYLQTRAVLQDWETTLKQRQAELNALTGDHPVVRALRECLACALAALSESPAASDNDFLPKLRFVTCALAGGYLAFCAECA